MQRRNATHYSCDRSPQGATWRLSLLRYTAGRLKQGIGAGDGQLYPSWVRFPRPNTKKVDMTGLIFMKTTANIGAASRLATGSTCSETVYAAKRDEDLTVRTDAGADGTETPRAIALVLQMVRHQEPTRRHELSWV